MEVENPFEAKEHLDELGERREGWRRYLAITTALIAVAAAIASLLSGNFVNSAILAKNEAVLSQSKASDQYAFFQAKGIKKNIAEFIYEQTHNPKQLAAVDRYTTEQAAIKRTADQFARKVEDGNISSEKQLKKHHAAAISVTFFQIAIALAAMSALLHRKSFWALSLVLAVAGGLFLAESLLTG